MRRHPPTLSTRLSGEGNTRPRGSSPQSRSVACAGRLCALTALGLRFSSAVRAGQEGDRRLSAVLAQPTRWRASRPARPFGPIVAATVSPILMPSMYAGVARAPGTTPWSTSSAAVPHLHKGQACGHDPSPGPGSAWSNSDDADRERCGDEFDCVPPLQQGMHGRPGERDNRRDRSPQPVSVIGPERCSRPTYVSESRPRVWEAGSDGEGSRVRKRSVSPVRRRKP